MNRIIYLALAFTCSISILAPTTVQSQDKIDIIGKLRFFSPAITQPQVLQYGTGTDYTDTTDREVEEFLPPFVPPGNSFLVYLDRACDANDGDPPCWWDTDLRAVPADVQSGEVKQFAIEYTVGVKNNTGGTLFLSILNPDWPDEVDSIHVEDAMLARAFNHTFTGPVQIEMTDPLTSQLKVIVYYNLNTLSVAADAGVESTEQLLLQPNPAHASTITVNSHFKVGESLSVANMRGQVLMETFVQEETASVQINTEALPSGMYVVVRMNEKGQVVAQEILQVVR